MPEETLRAAARATEGLSNRDLEEVVRKTGDAGLRRATEATEFVFDAELDGWRLPAPGDPRGAAKRMPFADIPPGKLRVARPSGDDLRGAISATPRTIATERLRRYEEWTREHGSDS